MKCLGHPEEFYNLLRFRMGGQRKFIPKMDQVGPSIPCILAGLWLLPTPEVSTGRSRTPWSPGREDLGLGRAPRLDPGLSTGPTSPPTCFKVSAC